MKLNKTALDIAMGWFVIWFGLFYAIADHPVPDGFWLVPVVLVALAGLVYWRVPVYRKRITSGRGGGFWKALLEGLVVGAVIAGFSFMLPRDPQPGVPDGGPIVAVVQSTVIGFWSVINAVGVFLVTRILVR